MKKLVSTILVITLLAQSSVVLANPEVREKAEAATVSDSKENSKLEQKVGDDTAKVLDNEPTRAEKLEKITDKEDTNEATDQKTKEENQADLEAQSNDEDKPPVEKPKDPYNDPLKTMRGLTELFSYNLFSGEAQFNFPFTLPKGRNNLTPQLSLGYSSLSKSYMSPAGYGFDISVSSIYRSAKHGVAEMYDRNDFAVKLNGKYAELVLVDATQNLYMDKNESSSFNRYYLENNTWRVQDTAGTTYYFGLDANSRQFDPDNPAHTFQWFLQKVVNSHGDTIEYSYFSETNQVYLNKIHYGFSGSDYLYEVDVDYQGKITSTTSYQSGFLIQAGSVLNKIYVRYKKDGNWQTFREYTLSYDSLSSPTPKLIKLEEKGQSTVLPAIEFVYYSDSGAVNLLKTINNNRGGQINLEYSPSVKYNDINGNPTNPKLPFILQTLRSIEYQDLINNVTQTKSFNYSGGHFYYSDQDVFGRQYAGFNVVTVTDAPGFVTKNFFHQSQFSVDQSQTLGEFDDHIAKKGQLFRQAIYDQNGNLIRLQLNKWQRRVLSGSGENERNFVYLDVNLQADLNGSSQRVRAFEYQYDFGTGNVLQEINWGEIKANLAPESGSPYDSLPDVGSDTIITVYDYAAPQISGSNLTSIPYQITNYRTSVETNNKLSQKRSYFDNLPLGQIAKGDQTKQEVWLKTDYGQGTGRGATVKLTNSEQYITAQTTTFNGGCGPLGLPDSMTDARGNVTNYAYDQFCLFPSTITYPVTTNEQNQTVNHVERFTYDYGHGQLTDFTDQNGQNFKKVYDDLGRLQKEYVPDSSGNLVAKTLIEYYDSLRDLNHPLSKVVKQRDRQDLGETEENAWHFVYEYYDGFGRTIQTKTETEDGYRIRLDMAYDQNGHLYRQSSPRLSTTGSFEKETAWTEFLYNQLSYDALSRPIATVAILPNNSTYGTATVNYAPWQETHTDMNGQKKDLIFDAYQRLIQVKEYNRADAQGNATTDYQTYLTNYTYDPAGNLVKITDSEGNIRELKFDSLNRRLALTDLHYPSKVNWNSDFGVYYFVYDNQGNITGQHNLIGEETTFSYDALNRVTKEDLIGTSQIEKTYFYDDTANGNFGISRLTKAITENVQSDGKTEQVTLSSVYDRLGSVLSQSKQLKSADGPTRTFSEQRTYDILQRLKTITEPGGYVVTYEYNPALLLEKVTKKYTASLNELTIYGKNGLVNGQTLQNQVTPDSGEVAVVLNIDYAPTGSMTRIDYFNGSSENFTYDPNQLYRLTRKATNDAQAKLIQDLNYTYDKVGNILSLEDKSATELKKVSNYSYDDLYRLSNASAIASSDLLGYWSFDEGAGTKVIDSSPNLNNGTLTTATYTAGKSGYALSFNGASGSVQITDSSAIQNIWAAGGSVSFWINPNSDGEGDSGEVISKYLPDSDGWGSDVQSDSGTACKVRFYKAFSGAIGIWETTSNVITNGVWNHVVITYNSSSASNDPTIYVNGVSVPITETSTPSGTSSSDVGNNLYFGNQFGDNQTFDGKIDEVKLYGQIISANDLDMTNPKDYTQTYRYSPAGNILYKSDQGFYKYPKDVDSSSKTNPQAVMRIVDANALVKRQIGYDGRGNINYEGYVDSSGQVINKILKWNYRNQLISGTLTKNNSGAGLEMIFAYDGNGQRISKARKDGLHVNFYPFGSYEEEYERNSTKEVYKLHYSTPVGMQTPQKQDVTLLLSETPPADPNQKHPASEIQTMINKAASGATVNVGPGTYVGNIILKAGITLKGSGPGKTILDGNKSGSVITAASNTVIQGFQIKNSGLKVISSTSGVTQVDSGIFVGSGMKNIVVKDNYFESNNAGVGEIKASNVTIQNNLFTNQKYSQIYLYQGGTVNILNNTIDKNLYLEGITAYKTTGITIKNNLITNNNGGITFWNIGGGYNISYNDVWNNQGSTGKKVNYLGCAPGVYNKNVDPQYVGTGTDEMAKHELKSTSPVLTAGENKTRMGWTRPVDYVPVDETIVMVNGVFYTHSDHLGSSSVTTDASGNVKQLLSYHPYGTTHFQKDSSDYQNDKKFTGKELDEELGWYYYGARYYDAEVGRFVSIDQIDTSIGADFFKQVRNIDLQNFLGDPQRLNIYSYTLNNPIKYNDPNGQFEFNPISAIFCFFFCGVPTAYAPDQQVNAELTENPQNGALKTNQLTAITEDATMFAVGEKIIGAGVKIAGKAIGEMVGGATTKTLSSAITSTFQEGKYTARILESDMKVWRVFEDTPNSLKEGRFFTNFIPSTSQEAIEKLGLPASNNATKVVEATIPKGTKIYEGAASGIEGRGPGGATQIYIEHSNVPTYGEVTKINN